MTTSLPVSHLEPPPAEITNLARLCLTGDIIENDDVSAAFHSELDTFLVHGHQSTDLWPVLLTAIQYSRPGIITLLLSRGLHLLSMHVNQAITTGSKEVFQAFLDNGWDLNEPLETFCPPVLAKFVHDHEMVMWFLDQGADPDARCYLDLTPLSLAARYASVSTFQVLLERGSVDKGQLVHHAVERDMDVIQVLDILVAKGAPLDELQYARDLPSWNHESFKGLGTPLHRATELGKLDVARYLLQNDANCNARDSRNRTPLEIAQRMRFRDLIDLFSTI